MILTIDVGNTSTAYGLFSGNTLKKRWDIETEKLCTNPKLNVYSDYKVIISSVVPRADKVLKKYFPKAVFIDAKTFKGIRLRHRNRREVGADRVVNAYAAKEFYGVPAIVVDFGTATTFDVISGKGEYLGGAIVPGIKMAAIALHENTAKLPKLVIKKPKKLVGASTVEAMRSGIFYGYIALVEGLIKRFREQNTEHRAQGKVIATGGWAKFIGKYAAGIDIIDADLTLKGLKLICQKS